MSRGLGAVGFRIESLGSGPVVGPRVQGLGVWDVGGSQN